MAVVIVSGTCDGGVSRYGNGCCGNVLMIIDKVPITHGRHCYDGHHSQVKTIVRYLVI